MFSYPFAFCFLFCYRYIRLVVNLFAFWTFKPIPLPEEPTLSSDDVTVIIPSLEGCGPELERTIYTILQNEPHVIMLVTTDANMDAALGMVKLMATNRIAVYSVPNPNKRRQMVRAIPEVTTKITIFADDDISWPPRVLPWILAPFEQERYGGVGTCQRIRRNPHASWSQWVWGFLDAMYLERRNFDCAATTHMDGGLPCLSGRTVAYRTKILQDEAFTRAFTSEDWLGRYRLNADDDNFITRWMVSHNWETYFQYHRECEIQTTLEDNPKFLKQCLRWARSNWRSNLKSMLWERHIWRRQLWSAYAVHLTTLSPPALIGDFFLVYFLRGACQTWDLTPEQTYQAMLAFLLWMFTSKWIKLLGHYIRNPVDVLLIPVSILFGYFHGCIKMYAMCTLTVTAWGSRAGADTPEADRIRRLTQSDRQEARRKEVETFTQ